jgi:hypothetical protein
MNWAEGIGIGLVVGMPASFWLLLTLLAIRVALGRGNNPAAAAASIAALLTLPAFCFGGTWVGSAVLPKTFVAETAVAYLYTLTIIVILVNIFPGYRLIVWAAQKMEQQ